MTEVLAGDFLLAEDFGLGAVEFGIGEAFGSEERRFLEQFFFHELGVFGGSAGVESEVAGLQAGKVLGADVVGEAEAFADAEEEAGAEVAAGFLDEFEGESVRDG